MMDFRRFPKTPHLAWLGSGEARGDKVMTLTEAEALLSQPVVVEEKLDGANLGMSVGPDGELQVQNRGSFLNWESLHPQFKPLRHWVSVRRHDLVNALRPGLTLFGEWCYAQHSVHYCRLPDWFVAFDVYDRAAERFWSVDRRNTFVRSLALAIVPEVARGRFDEDGIKRLLGPSKCGDVPAEGIYIRRDHDGWLERRAKLVRAEFTQTIGEHWSAGPLRTNQIDVARRKTTA